MAYATSATVINAAAREMGLISTDITDPFGSTDPNILQLCALLTSVGRKLVDEFHWSQLQTIYTFPTVDSQEAYALPADYSGMVDQTGWNRTTRFPFSGPVSGQAWEYLKALPSAATLTMLFRQNAGTILIYPIPGATVNTIAFEYMSSYWVALTGAPTTRVQDNTTLATDVLFFDPLLLTYSLKYDFLRAKGMPSQAAKDDYDERLDAIKNNEPAPAISLAGDSFFVPLLDSRNVPDTGYGV